MVISIPDPIFTTSLIFFVNIFIIPSATSPAYTKSLIGVPSPQAVISFSASYTFLIVEAITVPLPSKLSYSPNILAGLTIDHFL